MKGLVEPVILKRFSSGFYKIILVTFLCLTLGAFNAEAQWQFGFGLNGMGPVDRFTGSVYQPGMGVFTTLTSSSLLPKGSLNQIRLGIYLDYLNAGNKSFDVTLNDPPAAEGTTRLGNYSTAQHFFLRYGFDASDRITVFTDLITGHRKFYSQSVTGLKVHDEAYEDDYERIYTSNTLRYGVGFGMRYGFRKSFGVEVRADYTRGNRATYFDLNSIEETSTSITYKSETWAHSDLFVGSIAVNWKLFRSSYNTAPANSPQRNDYYDNYRSGSNGGSSTTHKSNTSTSSKRTTTKKKSVKSSKKVEEKKDEDKIKW